MTKNEVIVDTIMRRNGWTEEDAEDMIKELKDELKKVLAEEGPAWDSGYGICAEYFDLEPFRIMKLLYGEEESKEED